MRFRAFLAAITVGAALGTAIGFTALELWPRPATAQVKPEYDAFHGRLSDNGGYVIDLYIKNPKENMPSIKIMVATDWAGALKILNDAFRKP